MSVLAAHRNHPTYWAFVLHRASGLALALFLPIHLYVLSMAVGDGARLDAFLGWTQQPLVKAAEVGLVVLLALHMAGGLRLLAVEFLPWRDSQKTLAAVAGAFAVGAGILYLLNVV
jgi:fumarate reductase subunit D